MEKIERKQGTINREEKNWWEVEKIICDKIETRKIGMREQFKIGFSQNWFQAKLVQIKIGLDKNWFLNIQLVTK